LDTYLAQFFLSVRKVKKSADDAADREYEPNTLKVMHASIHRYLVDNLYRVSIKNDDLFKHPRDVLSAKVKQNNAINIDNINRAINRSMLLRRANMRCLVLHERRYENSHALTYTYKLQISFFNTDK
jgi:hypothetical protein